MVAKIGRFPAGVYEQAGDGWARVEWSEHRTPDAARRTAAKYARALATQVTVGGAYSWAAWFHDGAGVVEVSRKEG